MYCRRTEATVKIGDIEYLTATEVVQLADMKRDTFTSYVSRGQAPQPDLIVGRLKLYEQATITKWLAERPGRGHRTDLKPKSD